MDHACHLDGIIMEFGGEKGLVLIEAESHRLTVPHHLQPEQNKKNTSR